MASIGEDIRAGIIASTGIAALFDDISAPNVVEQNTVRQDAPSPRIWFQRDREEEETDLGGDGGLVESEWSLEVHTDDDDERFNIADAVKRALNGFEGTLGSRHVQGVFIDDHEDDYFPRGVGSEEGLYVAALRMRVFFEST